MKNILAFIAFTFYVFALSVSANAEALTLCTGSKSGVYYGAGNFIAKTAKGIGLEVEVVTSKGSWENVKDVANGKCDAAIIQADAYALFAKRHSNKVNSIDRIGALHKEYAHLVCNKDSGVDDLSDLESGKYPLAVGKAGSGAWVMMQNIIQEDDGYKAVKLIDIGGIRAAAAVADGTETACLLSITGLGSSSIAKIDTRFGDRVILASTTGDGDFNDAQDPKGNALYEWDEIPAKTYPNALQNGMFSSVKTISQRALLIANVNLADDDEVYEQLIEAYSMAYGKILAFARSE